MYTSHFPLAHPFAHREITSFGYSLMALRFPHKYWWVVLVAVPIAAALIPVIIPLFSEGDVSVSNKPTETLATKEKILLSQQRKAAEKLGTDWLSAVLHRDSTTLLDLSDTPFFFDGEIIVGPEDINNAYTSFLLSDEFIRGDIQIRSIFADAIEHRVKSFRRWGRWDIILSTLNPAETDFVVLLDLESRERGPILVMLVTRRVGRDLKLAGWSKEYQVLLE